jgi:hypothetical protein
MSDNPPEVETSQEEEEEEGYSFRDTHKAIKSIY